MYEPRLSYILGFCLFAIASVKVFTTSIEFIKNNKELATYTTIHRARNKWIAWNKPKDHIQHCIAWLFNTFPSAKFHVIDERTDDEMIICSFEIVGNIDQEKLREADIGHINVISTTNLHGKQHTIIDWFMNSLVNTDITRPNTSLQIFLGAIIKAERGWYIDINKQWLHVSNLPHKLTIDKYELTIETISMQQLELSIIKADNKYLQYALTCGDNITLDFV